MCSRCSTPPPRFSSSTRTSGSRRSEALSIDKALNETLGKDFKRAEMFSLPVTLAILLIAFGALIAAGVPLLLALSAVAAAIGLSALASQLVPAVDAMNSVILLIGMAVGVDYSLFYLRREREERAKGRGHVDAVEIAAATSGHAVVVSGIAVIISMAGLFLAGDAMFSSLRGRLDPGRRGGRRRFADRAARRYWRSWVAGSTGRGSRWCGA